MEFIKNSTGKGISVDDLESYIEIGMRAEITGGRENGNDVLMFNLDYSKFSKFNESFEIANYYDANGVPCLTARQAGHYKDQDTLHLMATDRLESIFAWWTRRHRVCSCSGKNPVRL